VECHHGCPHRHGTAFLVFKGKSRQYDCQQANHLLILGCWRENLTVGLYLLTNIWFSLWVFQEQFQPQVFFLRNLGITVIPVSNQGALTAYFRFSCHCLNLIISGLNYICIY
jgi:hypothetical protein